ncbi:hypothetical protein DFP93_10437 [Aneurinibacillus soli]|uniref:Uncharacterized protein n=1 Tax=Aneurinibacillus soli TaxID=1500254 RepID=A0A0U5AT22_9BACL|nr:hypothetical protein [Aneurinibacillus soli]PYE62391.1 hypothetical protein DFP93_10437 [Aneurinibacillus soli]BAU26954.1 hypothetical protein CB4_01123 [Aneurinibacillus soli]
MKEVDKKQQDNVVLFPGSGERRFQMVEASVLRRLDEQEGYAERLCTMLHAGTVAEQLAAVEQLTYIYDDATITALRSYIEGERGDPVAKTLALRALKEQGQAGMIGVRKFGRLLTVDISEVPLDDGELPVGQAAVMHELERVTEAHDASVLPLALQLWTTYFFMAYPLVPDVDAHGVGVWASALHYAVTKLLGTGQTVERIADLYDVDGQAVSRCYQELQAVPGLISGG